MNGSNSTISLGLDRCYPVRKHKQRCSFDEEGEDEEAEEDVGKDKGGEGCEVFC